VKGKQEGEVEEEMTDQHKKMGICGKTQQHKLGVLRKKLLHVRIANPHMRRLVSGAITGGRVEDHRGAAGDDLHTPDGRQ
jgi:hypothetical protein